MSFENILKELKGIGVSVSENEPLSLHTSFRVGGCAALFVEASNIQQLKKTYQILKKSKVKFYVLGKGTNLIGEDHNLELVIVHLADNFSGIEASGNLVTALAGTQLIDVCTFARDNSLSGLEFAYGIPGSVGGGIYMNAGAYGGELSDLTVSVEYINENGEISIMTGEELDFSYRHSAFTGTNMWIVSATFELNTGSNRETISHDMNEILSRRKERQPLEFPSAGSTFKRPEGSTASELIDSCGLKGLSVGDAQVSTKHAGFVINTGNATCENILQLTEIIKRIVYDKTGFKLEREVLILGNDGLY